MSKLNYSSSIHTCRMIKLHTEEIEKLLQGIEYYKKVIFELADTLKKALEENRPGNNKG